MMATIPLALSGSSTKTSSSTQGIELTRLTTIKIHPDSPEAAFVEKSPDLASGFF
jgi:hypothetical protein